ncbi:MAG TPA: flagellar hook-basal body complex protein FliE [Gemmatimonadaceae bacterium]|jgi:flagellar hook-basal body complex protein FliE
MTVPIGGLGGPGSPYGPKRIGLDIAGENGLSGLSTQNSGPTFGDSLKRALNDVSTSQDVSQDYIQKFVRGEPVELHQVMAAAEEASISLEMLVELRNKLMDAYKTVMSMG